MTARNRPFNSRSFAAVLIALSGLGLPVSGIANHLLQFEPMTRERHVWMAVHNGLATIFAFACLWHVVVNRRALVAYVRGAATAAAKVSREAVLACAVVAATMFVLIGHALHLG